ncbi:MAG: hypothetical protein V7733_16980 [Paraglaciecola polaris]|uniref:hypothetical protein n=1 Tax=Paraglaciecola polaris TaxID=222814 RepID=UPI003002A9B4|tara:strand:- start:7433 stop:7699 length:267 start_codon:yes stop_codon:yes gene_type:complete
MLNGQFFSRALLSQRLTDVEGVERQAHANQEMILARRAQITSATKELCRQPLTPIAAFAAGSAAGVLNDSKPSAMPLIMRIVTMARLF